MHGQEKAFVEIKMPEGRQESKTDDFQLELSGVDGNGEIGQDKERKLEVENDICKYKNRISMKKPG